MKGTYSSRKSSNRTCRSEARYSSCLVISSRTQDFASRYRKNFYVFSPQADKITTGSGNVFKIANVQNLNDLNITFRTAMETLPKATANKIIIIDLLSEVLL